MRRIAIWLALVLCLGLLCLPVSAATGATNVQCNATVLADGSAQVSITVRLHLDEPQENLQFPIPAQAENVLLNGAQVRTRISGTIANVQLGNFVSGDSGFTVSYSLPRVVELQTDEDEENEKLMLVLPVLSGFFAPIETMELSVILPAAVPNRPGFSSGYHQQGIESDMQITWQDNTISAETTGELKDHETLQLALQVTPEMFPQLSLHQPPVNGWEASAIVLAVLAVLYYLICLLPSVPRRIRCFSAPEGISAGEVGTCLTGSGVDLTLLVFSWAQLGYIRIELTHKDKVTLVRRMDMGNERSDYEVRIFKALFQGRQQVAGSSYHYARMCRKVAASSPLHRQLFKASSGNPKVFRGMAAASGALWGVSMAISVTELVALQALLGVVLVPLCGILAYSIQAGGCSLPLRERQPLYWSLAACGAWLTLGLLMGVFAQTLGVVAFQFLCGVAAAYGGQRTERGRRCLAQLRSLRKFMVATAASELQRMLQANPNYFYELAPYALAMGVDRQFARKFSSTVLPDCSFLVTSSHRELTAPHLMSMMRRAARSLNALQKRLPYENLRKR